MAASCQSGSIKIFLFCIADSHTLIEDTRYASIVCGKSLSLRASQHDFTRGARRHIPVSLKRLLLSSFSHEQIPNQPPGGGGAGIELLEELRCPLPISHLHVGKATTAKEEVGRVEANGGFAFPSCLFHRPT